jgi:hypothetical protein
VSVDHEVVVRRGPLPEPWRSEVIEGWSRYDPRLADRTEWRSEFEDGPEGAALHVLVVDGEGRVAGHHSAIPLAFREGERSRIVGKGEAIYVDRSRAERGARVLVGGRPVRLVEALGTVLFAEYPEHGMEAYIGYGKPQSEARLVEAGCRVLVLPYERFFFLHDADAALGASPGRLGRGVGRRAARLAVGARATARGGREGLEVREVDELTEEHERLFRGSLPVEGVALDPSLEQLEWRFPSALYRRFSLGSPVWGYAVLTRVEPTRRVRVVDWLVPPARAGAAPEVTRVLAGASAEDGAAALEWSVPVNSPAGAALARGLRRAPLVRDPRRRSFRMLVHGSEPFDDAARWLLTLATQERF